MIKIGYVHSVAALGGAERMTEALVRELNTTEYKPLLLCPEKGAMPSLFEELGINTQQYPLIQPSWTSPLQTFKGKKYWKEIIKKNNLKLLHTADLVCTRTLLQAAKSQKVPVVCHIHFPFKKSYSDWVFKNLPKPSAFIFCSQELKNDVGPHLTKSCPSSKQTVIHNGVDIEYFQPAKRVENKIKRIGIVANLQKRKGHEDFLKMAKLVLENYPHVHFDIIGGDILQQPREPELKQLSTSLNISQHVTFHGQVNNVKKLVNNLDIFVCASHQEAFPVSILEAMAAEKAIVTTNVNGIPEAITHHHCGLLVNPKSPEELAKSVLNLLLDPKLRNFLACNARKRAIRQFSRQSYANSIKNLYKNLVTSP